MRGAHAIFDFYQTNEQTIAYVENLKKALTSVFKTYNLDIKQDLYYQFEPFGVTATLIADECQLNIHTWPENKSCTVDFYSAMNQTEMMNFCEVIKKQFEASEYDMRMMRVKDT